MLPCPSLQPTRKGRGSETYPQAFPYLVLHPVGFTLPPLLPVCRVDRNHPAGAVRSYRTFSPYPDKIRLFVFCGTVPGVAPAGYYPVPCFRDVRTFLSHLADQSGHSAIWSGGYITKFRDCSRFHVSGGQERRVSPHLANLTPRSPPDRNGG